ncbi:MAG TPA: DUF2911 domain-containing protein [Gemmatimonadaceae bacterium]|nr:DUF2911 domain-containing protein [Gemmatimonadaceae bacterium]
MRLSHRLRGCGYASALALLTARGLGAQGTALADEGAFLIRLGRDTVAVERFKIAGSTLEGELVLRSPSTVIRRFSATLGPDGTLTRAQWTNHAPNAPATAPPRSSGTATVGTDSVTVETRQGDSTRIRRIVTRPGLLPLIFPGFAGLQLAVQRFRQLARDSATVNMYFLGGVQQVEMSVKRAAPDTVHVQHLVGLFELKVDSAGRVVGARAPRSTFQVMVERLRSVDLQTIATRWAAADTAGRGLGQLSPRDTVTAAVAGANLWIDYSRPQKRGREVFGGVVPWGQVWRTGANSATQFRSDRDLTIGSATIPAGTYTLWTLPTQQGWKLIVNKQTGQWGTEYDPAQDLVRVDMTTERLPSTLEQFTIAIETQRQGALLKLAWDRTQASVVMRVK